MLALYDGLSLLSLIVGAGQHWRLLEVISTSQGEGLLIETSYKGIIWRLLHWHLLMCPRELEATTIILGLRFLGHSCLDQHVTEFDNRAGVVALVLYNKTTSKRKNRDFQTRITKYQLDDLSSVQHLIFGNQILKTIYVCSGKAAEFLRCCFHKHSLHFCNCPPFVVACC